MVRLVASLAVLIAASTPSQAGGPTSRRARHFRLEVGVGDIRTVHGWIDESGGTGKGYDRLALDLDGDGRADVTSAFEPTDPESDTWTTPTISFRHEHATWTLDFNDDRFDPGEDPVEGPETWFSWSVWRGDRFALFVNGPMGLHTSAAAARRAKAARLGPPFHLECGVGTRGPTVMLSAALRDSNGCTLRVASEGTREAKIHATLLDADRVVLRRTMEYG
jgi:hypothetical protein